MVEGGSSAGIRVGPFVLDACVGQGGMGEVWRGHHREQTVPVAIKVITAAEARDPDVCAAFRNEVRAVARLDHPGIVRVLDYGAVDAAAERDSGGRLVRESPFLAMELLSGGSLHQAAPPSGWPALERTLLDLLDALAHAHSRGVVHRDLKPRNVLFADETSDRPGLRLTDFGIAHALGGDDPDDPEGTTGTPWYMAPEQLHDRWRDYGPWTDLYAFGCIAWELATGSRPFEGGSLFAIIWSHLNTELPDFQPRFAVPTGFEAWVRQLLEKNHRGRFRRAADAAFALRELEEDPVWGPPPLPLTWRVEHSSRSTPERLLGAGLGLHGLRRLPVLGRQHQLDQAWAALRSVWASAAPRLVLLRGEAGCGKSRIAEFICERAEEVGGATMLRVVHDPVPTPTTGLRGMILRTLGCVGLERAGIEARIEEQLTAEGVTDPYEWQALTEFVAPARDWVGEVNDQPVRFVDPLQRNALLQRLLARRAAQRPLILWMDDVQWGSQALSFAEHVMDSAPLSTGPLLLLLTARSEALDERPLEARRVAALLGRPGTSVLDVPPLDDLHSRALVRDALGLEGDLAEAVEIRAGGNPLFAVQLVGDWIRRGLLQAGERGFTMKGQALPVLLLPVDIHQIWQDRLNRLVEGFGGAALETLELAAALGLQVDALEWNHACDQVQLHADPGLIDALLTEGMAEPNEGGWAFASELLRETLERSARAEGRWAVLNDACGAMLRTRYPKGARGVALRLGTHLREAERLHEAVDQLGEAAWELVDCNEYRGALQVAVLREQCLRHMAADRSDVRWGECLLIRCGANLQLGRHDEALEEARQAEVESARHGWQTILARALGQQGTIARLRGDLGEAIERWEEALRLCPADDRDSRARLLYYLASVQRQQCEFDRAGELYREALDLYGEVANQLGEAQCLFGLATIAQDVGDLDTSERVFESLLRLFRRLGNRFGIAQALNGLAGVAHLRGNLDEAGRGYGEAWDLLESIGSPASITAGLNVALLHVIRRDLDALREALHRIESRRAAAAQRPWLGQLLVYRLPLLAEQRSWDAWDRTLERAAELLRERAGAPQDIATVARIAGELAVEAGQVDRGRQAYLVARQQWELVGEGAGVTVIDALLSRLPG
jgi:eukaryotic-like serine/threonine-protein kinase